MSKQVITLVLLLIISGGHLSAQDHQEISITYFTQSLNEAVFVNYKIGKEKYLFVTGPGILLSGRPHIPDAFNGVRIAYLNSFAYYPNGMSNRFNLFLHVSLVNIYYKTEIDKIIPPPNYQVIPLEKRRYLDNSLLLGFGFQIHFLKQFSFSVSAGLGPFLEYDEITGQHITNLNFSQKSSALDFGLAWRLR